MPCDEYCDFCYYNTLVFDPDTERRYVACDYIGYIGHRRPCKAGRLCTVRIELEHPKRKSDTHDRYAQAYHLHVKEVLAGRQREALTEFMQQTGETKHTIAKQLGIKPDTVRKWLSEHQFANWAALAAIGMEKPPGMPTITTHPIAKRSDNSRGTE